MAGNGKTCSASSNGVNMDLTPPELDFYFYLDAASTGLSSQAPVQYQASNSTIQIFWRFVDVESEIQVGFIEFVLVCWFVFSVFCIVCGRNGTSVFLTKTQGGADNYKPYSLICKSKTLLCFM